MAKSNRKPRPNPPHPKTDWHLVEVLLTSPVARTLYLFGPPGVGKTYSAYHMGRTDAGVYPITLTEDAPVAELRGHYVPVGSALEWRDGPFTKAMREGARLVVNEVSHASPEALTFLHPVLESKETAQMVLPTNEIVRPAPGFHVVLTDNCSPEQLPEALRDRFECVLQINEPHPDALAQLDDDLARAARRTFALEQERAVGLRAWLSIGRLRPELGQESACRAVLGAERGGQLHEALVLAAAAGRLPGMES